MTTRNPRLFWRTTAVALGILAALQLWHVFEFLYAPLGRSDPLFAVQLVERLVIHVAMVVCVTVGTLIADAAVDGGREPLTAYGAAVVGGTAVASLLQDAAIHAFGLRTEFDVPELASRSFAQPVRVGLEYLLWATLIVSVYASMRMQRRAAARLRAIQVEQAQVRRRAAQASLDALLSRVDPQQLLDTLARVREGYATDPAGSGQLLDDFVARLRSRLPVASGPVSGGDVR